MTITCNTLPVQKKSTVKKPSIKSRIQHAFDEIGYRLLQAADVRFTSTTGKGKDLIFPDWEHAKQWLITAGCWKV